MLRVLIFLASTIFACISAKDQIPKLEGGYVAVKSEGITVELRQVADSLFGHHCFVNRNGTRIDCCLDSADFSMKLGIDSSGVFRGTLSNCYDQETHDITIVQTGANFTLVFTKNPHPFLSDSVMFTPAKF
jgi:hypothetical protein